jgi:hypothetical protein
MKTCSHINTNHSKTLTETRMTRSRSNSAAGTGLFVCQENEPDRDRGGTESEFLAYINIISLNRLLS